jgi:two-component system, chemotaxis family, sensor kinase CheA
MIDDKALLSEYMSESEELLDSLLADLDSLAADPDINLINRIFRTVHSLKGLSGMMGLDEVQSLAHEFEDILDDLRLGHLSLKEETTTALQEVGAGLASLVGGAAHGSAGGEDFERLRSLLTAVAVRPDDRKKKGDTGVESLNLSERERGLLTEYEEHRVNENLNAGRSFFAIIVQFEIGSLDTQYRALISRLESTGEVVTTLPETAAEQTRVSFKLIYATQLKESDLKSVVEAFDGRVTRLGPSPWRRAGKALRSVGRKQKESKKKPDRKTSGGKLKTLLPPAFAQESLHPLSQSVRVEMSQIDELSGLAHELSIEMERLASMAHRFLQAGDFGAREQFDLRFSARRIEREFLELEERLVELRMISLAQTFTRAARLAGRLARELGKSVSVEIAGRDTQLDKMIVDRISDSIYHVLRNAIDHGVELPEARRLARKNARGKIRIEAGLEGTRAVIAITDDGLGIDRRELRRRAIEAGLIAESEELTDEETLRLILRPGFSTADHVSAVSGRGVGLDAVERTMHELGGEVRISSEQGKWTRFELAVPTTLVMISAFIVRASDWRYAINVGQIVELLYVKRDDILGPDGRRSIEWRGSTIPLVELKYLLGLGGARVFPQPAIGAGAPAATGPLNLHRGAGRADNNQGKVQRIPVFITRAGERNVAVAVEQFDEQREIIVKSLGSLARKIKGVIGAVDLEGGDVALVLDLPSLLLLRSLRM